MPPAGKRKEAWVRGLWDATWYCIDCYMRYSICSIARAAKKALYAHGENQNAIRHNDLTRHDLAPSVLVSHVLTRRDLD